MIFIVLFCAFESKSKTIIQLKFWLNWRILLNVTENAVAIYAVTSKKGFRNKVSQVI